MVLPPMPNVPKQMAPAPGMPMGIRKQDEPAKKEEAKYSDYIRQEKLRTFKRLPKLIGKRNSVPFNCPSCKKDGDT